MTSVSKYRVYCITEARYLYIWDTMVPTKCTNDATHAINVNDIAVVDTISSQDMVIREEMPPASEIPTQGYFKSVSKKISVNANSSSFINLSWKYPVSILSLKTHVVEHQQGDRLVVKGVSDVIVGVLTAGITEPTNILNVSSTVISTMKKGFLCSLLDSSNGNHNSLGEVNDTSPTTITTDSVTTTTFGAGTTYVKMTNVMIDITFGSPGYLVIGDTKVGSSYVKKNQVIVSEYTNNSNIAKDVYIYIEYLY